MGARSLINIDLKTVLTGKISPQLLMLGLCLSFLTACNLFAGSEDDKKGNQDQVSTDSKGQSSAPKVDLAKDQEQAKPSVPKGAVASVNGSLVSQKDFDLLFEERARVYRLQKRPIPPRLVKTYKTSALQKLIDQVLLQQHFDQNNLALSEDDKSNAYQVYKDRFRGEKSFQRFLKRSQKTEADVQAQVYFDALVDKAINTLNGAEVHITDEETNKYYQQYKVKKYTKKAQVRVSHILIPASASAGKKKIRQQKRVASKLYRTLKKANPQEFAKAAQKHSADASTRMRGGDLGYFEKKGGPMIDQKFEKALQKLKVGEISKPFLSTKGYHLVRLTDRQSAQVRVSHILLDDKATDAEIKKIIARAQIEDFYGLAKELSQDETTRIRGGDLGFIHSKNPHRFGEAFKTVVLKGGNGEILGPIQSASGKHIVYITQRRPERYRASHILKALPKKAKRAQKKKALADITKLHEELIANQRTANSLFVRLAKKYSDDPTRDRGGDLGAFYLGGEPKFSKKFENAVFKGAIAKTLAPVSSPFGWHIYFIHDRKDTRAQSYEEVKTEIHDQLKDKRLRRSKSSLIKKLRSEAKIKRYIEL